MSSSSSRQIIEVITTEEAPLKWSVALREEVFRRFLGQGTANTTLKNKIFGEGSIFSPLLFGKFFDPSDAFPLWEFEPDVLLAALRSSGKSTVDWYQSDEAYVLKAELPAAAAGGVKVCVENGKVVEICGQWKPMKDDQSKAKPGDWRSGHWWESGYVRRLELPEDAAAADWKQIEANLTTCSGTNETTTLLLALRVPKKSSSSGDCNTTDPLP